MEIYNGMPTEVKYDRAEVQDLIERYFDVLGEATRMENKEEGIAAINEFLTEDYLNRESDWPRNRSKAQFASWWIGCAPRYYREFHMRKPDGYAVIDCRTGIVCVCARQEVYRKKTGEIVRAGLNSIHMEVKYENGKLKIARECWTTFPALFATDHLDIGDHKDGKPCWLYKDYSKEFEV